MNPHPLIPAKAGTQIQSAVWLAILPRSGVDHSARNLGPGLRRDERIGKGSSQ
jgi:hypothetical protein